MVRKDWNILTAKMYWGTVQSEVKSDEFAGQVREILNELHFQIDSLIDGPDLVMFHDLDRSWLAPITVDIVIIDSQAATLLRAIQSMDAAMALMYSAERQELLTKVQRYRLFAGVTFAYTALKHFLIRPYEAPN
jgi:hypothetical protein